MTYIVRSKDRRSNITYAYEVTSYRDKSCLQNNLDKLIENSGAKS